jgi:hypothetical protein
LQWCASAGAGASPSASPNAAANIVDARVIFVAFIAFPLFVPDPESWLIPLLSTPFPGARQ